MNHAQDHLTRPTDALNSTAHPISVKTNGMALSKAQLSKVKKHLIALGDELTAVSTLSADARKPVQLDQTSVGRLSRMDAMQGQAMQLETERRRAIEQQRIEAALLRIRDGDFGYCTECGEDIALKRLEYDPTVPTCIDCQRARD
jgi:DnaK suppressor protein